MSTSPKQETAFTRMVGEELPKSLLGASLDWIRDNLNPDAVFEQSRLNRFVGNTATPDEVFSDEELKAWALKKGFTAPEKKHSYLES